MRERKSKDIAKEIISTVNPVETLKNLLASHSIASKNWVYRQYDQSVRSNTVLAPGSDAAIIRIKHDSIPVMPGGVMATAADIKEKLIAMTVDCNGGYVYLDPYEGGKAAVTEAARNLACSGATPRRCNRR